MASLWLLRGVSESPLRVTAQEGQGAPNAGAVVLGRADHRESLRRHGGQRMIPVPGRRVGCSETPSAPQNGARAETYTLCMSGVFLIVADGG